MIEITRAGKYSLIIDNPVMIATGMAGFDATAYRDLIDLEKLGAVVTAGISWRARGPAYGPRVVPIGGGFLLHTGLPNPGARNVIKKYSRQWSKSSMPMIAHVISTTYEDVVRCAEALEGSGGVVGIELGLRDDVLPDELTASLDAVREGSQLPILLKLPLHSAVDLWEIAEQSGADALVVAAPPRGTDRDPISGQLVGGRLYGPWLKPQVLRIVGQIAELATIPVIACGGIHTPDDARDYIGAGARAVQIDSLTWVNPGMVEVIARNLGGLELTRAVGALGDEWEPGLGKTQVMQRVQGRSAPPPASPPPQLPELPPRDEDQTAPTDPTNDL